MHFKFSPGTNNFRKLLTASVIFVSFFFVVFWFFNIKFIMFCASFFYVSMCHQFILLVLFPQLLSATSVAPLVSLSQLQPLFTSTLSPYVLSVLSIIAFMFCVEGKQ